MAEKCCVCLQCPVWTALYLHVMARGLQTLCRALLRVRCLRPARLPHHTWQGRPHPLHFKTSVPQRRRGTERRQQFLVCVCTCDYHKVGLRGVVNSACVVRVSEKVATSELAT
uniref:Uncharacterized protein n=1 Tax=Ixodes ricinus TaxID=34613 RepID=A0A6B0UKA1_IXORI